MVVERALIDTRHYHSRIVAVHPLWFCRGCHVVMTVRSAGDASKLANFGSWPPAVMSYSAWGRLSLRSKQPSKRVD
ncbi:hypothetical protein PgNI_06152 [Pyricularia grisea]|uniref:Uncharacterized protein n=1 Tax=Pyricularia grisea TaxID=148305 RepID=A0A6P8B7S1_PYRGI|nr:hypothetical protein PgNI_06152 [Pyricularia grisea]TLD11293.1 hypothetical protein PgNI_06152 [Pyricularia grisea]